MTAMLVCRSELWFSVARFGSARPSRAKTQRGQDRFSTLAFGPFVFDLPSPLFIGPPLDFIFQEYLLSLSPDRQHFRCFCPFLPTRHEAFGQMWAIHGPFAKSTSRSWYSGSSKNATAVSHSEKWAEEIMVDFFFVLCFVTAGSIGGTA